MRGKKLWDRTADLLQPLGSNAPGFPLVELIGNCRMLVENHKGLIGYTDSEVFVKVRGGLICIKGACLNVCKMTNSALVIKGRIFSVEYPREKDL